MAANNAKIDSVDTCCVKADFQAVPRVQNYSFVTISLIRIQWRNKSKDSSVYLFILQHTIDSIKCGCPFLKKLFNFRNCRSNSSSKFHWITLHEKSKNKWFLIRHFHSYL